MKFGNLDYLTLLLIISSFIVLFTLGYSNIEANENKNYSYIPIEDWNMLLSSEFRSDPIIVEFFNYDCPSCRIQHDIFSKLKNKNKNLIIVYKHFPFGSQITYLKSIASECARKFNRFDKYHNLLFKTIEFDAIKIAIKSGIKDINDFKECYANQETAGIINKQLKEAHYLNIKGVPTLIIDRKLTSGSKNYEEIDYLLSK